MSTRSKLLEKTGDLQLPEVEPPGGAATAPSGTEAGDAGLTGSAPAFSPPAIHPMGQGARTAPGRMLAFREQVLNVEGEVAKLRGRLKEFEGAQVTRRLDPKHVVPSQWANRHPDSFENAAFEGLKQDIAQAGGNSQAIAVRMVPGQADRYEIVFGHRRHRACLELGMAVLATVIAEPLGDDELFAAMDRENRERADLSPYEQGRMYRQALDAKLYPSVRRLAEALGVSHTWVGNVLSVADLPESVLECFRSPLEVQHRHAKAIHAALEQDRKAVLRRAERLRAAGERLPPAQVLQALCQPAVPERPRQPIPLIVNGRKVGTWQRGAGGSVTVEMAAARISDEALGAALQRLAETLV